MLKKNKLENFLLEMRPPQRAAISIVFAAITFYCTGTTTNTFTRILAIWNVFAFTYLLTSWVVLIKRPTEQIKKIARKEDGSMGFVITLILVASFAGMFAVLLLILSKEAAGSTGNANLFIAITGMLLSWLMVHTTFAFHYAHLFYNNAPDGNKNAEGLSFPGTVEPDYLDFVYFSFVIGMTFQVSDVEINTRIIRRTALVHALLSFGLNTFVVALTINIIAGLKH